MTDHLLAAEQLETTAAYLEHRDLGYGGSPYGDAWSNPTAPCIEGALSQALGVSVLYLRRLDSYEALRVACGYSPWIWNDARDENGRRLHTKQDALDLLRSTAKAERILAEQGA